MNRNLRICHHPIMDTDPISPFFIYDGYYDVEKLGLKGESQKRMIISKFSRSRKLYDTHAMRKEMKNEVIPLVPWSGDTDAQVKLHNEDIPE